MLSGKSSAMEGHYYEMTLVGSDNKQNPDWPSLPPKGHSCYTRSICPGAFRESYIVTNIPSTSTSYRLTPSKPFASFSYTLSKIKQRTGLWQVSSFSNAHHINLPFRRFVLNQLRCSRIHLLDAVPKRLYTVLGFSFLFGKTPSHLWDTLQLFPRGKS